MPDKGIDVTCSVCRRNEKIHMPGFEKPYAERLAGEIGNPALALNMCGICKGSLTAKLFGFETGVGQSPPKTQAPRRPTDGS